ncbi:hypothetical protein HPB49_015792 [Dermacentor silvarum]|uniref:Uncharacterized protein n=1 Tax=Dermacentor silvarum TaxID=543639 RepID=A0ACB8CA33_DERSI|nr:hypothetical protein HPB49_015792 [Dermacentor silvarum]
MDSFKRHESLLVDELKLSDHLSVTYAAIIEDFPHLVKCLRNNLLSHNLDTPGGPNQVREKGPQQSEKAKTSPLLIRSQRPALATKVPRSKKGSLPGGRVSSPERTGRGSAMVEPVTLEAKEDNIRRIVSVCLVLHNFLLKEAPGSKAMYCPPGTTDTEDWQGNLTDGSWRADGTDSEAMVTLHGAGSHSAT